MLQPGDDIVELAANAVDAGADAIGAAGGDGSLGLVARVAIERDVPFFCVPVGTRNHFALDLGLDREDPLSALDAIRDGEEIDIDYGLAGDRPFLNNVSFGIYAEAVHRPEYRESKQETLAAVVRDMQADGGSGAAIRFATPQGEQAEQTAVTLVSNNPYVFSGPPDYGRRTRLDAGVMGITTIARGTDTTGVATGGAEGVDRSMAGQQVVDPGSAHELPTRTRKGRWSEVVEHEVESEHIVGGDSCLVGYLGEEGALLRLA